MEAAERKKVNNREKVRENGSAREEEEKEIKWLLKGGKKGQ